MLVWCSNAPMLGAEAHINNTTQGKCACAAGQPYVKLITTSHCTAPAGCQPLASNKHNNSTDAALVMHHNRSVRPQADSSTPVPHVPSTAETICCTHQLLHQCCCCCCCHLLWVTKAAAALFTRPARQQQQSTCQGCAQAKAVTALMCQLYYNLHHVVSASMSQ
jgi:hypothetical protein